MTKGSTETLSIQQYAARHGVCKRTVYRWMRVGEMPPDYVEEYRVPGARRVVVLTMDEFADRLVDAGPARRAREREAREAAAFAE